MAVDLVSAITTPLSVIPPSDNSFERNSLIHISVQNAVLELLKHTHIWWLAWQHPFNILSQFDKYKIL